MDTEQFITTLTDREKEALTEGRINGRKGPLAANLRKKGAAERRAGRVRSGLTQLGADAQAKLRESPPQKRRLDSESVSRLMAAVIHLGGSIKEISFHTGIPQRSLYNYAQRLGPIAPQHERPLADYLGLAPPLEAQEEKRRIVEWLRANASPEIAPIGHLAFRVLADAIERGDYEPPAGAIALRDQGSRP